MSLITYRLFLVATLLVAVSRPAISVAELSDLPPPPESRYICASLSEAELGIPNTRAAVDHSSAFPVLHQLSDLAPAAAFGLFMFIPVEGWAQSFAAKGEFKASLSIDFEKLPIVSIPELIGRSTDSVAPLTAEEIAMLHSRLNSLAEAEHALLEPDELIEVSSIKKMSLIVEHQKFDLQTGEIYPALDSENQMVELRLRPIENRSVPVLSESLDSISVPVFEVELEHVSSHSMFAG